MPRTKQYKITIDGEKFKNEIALRGMTLKEVAEKTYRPYSTICNAAHRNEISKEVAGAIYSLCGIPLSAYQVGKAQETKTETAFDMDALYKLIYSAVYDAVKKAWNE